MMKHTFSKMNNEEAGAGAIGSLYAIFVVGLIESILGYVIFKMQPVFVGLSANGSNTVYILEAGFLVIPVIWLVALVVNHWLNEKSEANMRA